MSLQDQDEPVIDRTRLERAVAKLIARQLVRTDRAREDGPESLEHKVGRQISPVLGDRHALPVQDDVPLIIQVDIGIRVGWHPDAELSRVRTNHG
jgi:hypothetical protein